MAPSPVARVGSASAEPTPAPIYRDASGPLSFRRLEIASFTHSSIYLSLLTVAGLVHIGHVGGLRGALFVLGMAHGLGWIAMSLVAIAALRARVIGMRLAVAVAVVGAVGPFVGSWEFVRESRRRCAPAR